MGLLAKLSPLLQTNPAEENAKALKKFKKSKESQELVAWVKQQYTKSKQSRSKETQQWNLNLAMYFGNQNVMVQKGGTDSGKLFTPPKQRSVERLIINRIRPMVRTELARMLSQKPAASVIPASSEDEDLMAAMAGEQVWESLYNRRKYHVHFSRVAFWTAITGTGFMKTYWDENKEDPSASEPGDIVFSCVQPYNLFVPDLLEWDIEDQPYVLEVQVKPIEWLNYIFKESLDSPVVSEARASSSLLEDAYVNQRSDTGSESDSAYVYEMWVKPGGCKYLPRGGFIMIVGNEIVAYYNEGIPYEHKEYPYAKFEGIPTSKFYAASVIEDVISLQKEYNKIRSQIADNRRKVGNIQFTAYKGSIMPEKVTNEVGQFIIVRPGMQQPQQLQPANLPAYITENMDRVLSDIEDISGQHQVSKGNVPPGITAATAISYLQERDDSLLTHTYQSIEQGTEKVAKHGLSLAVQYWEQPRLIKIVGADGAFDTNQLSGADLVAGTDIRIEAGSALPQSKAAKQALIMDMMKFGWVKVDDGLKMMEIGGAQKIFENIRSDERQAQRENIRMKTLTTDIIAQYQEEWDMAVESGDPKTQDINEMGALNMPPVITVNSYDNHQVHIDTHDRFRRGQAFELLDDEIKAQFEVHVQQHKIMLMQAQLEQTMGTLPPEGADMGAPEDMGADPMGADPMAGGSSPEGEPPVTGGDSQPSDMMQAEGGVLGG